MRNGCSNGGILALEGDTLGAAVEQDYETNLKVTEARLLRSYYAFQFLYSSAFYQAIFFVFYAEQVGLTAAAVLSLQAYYLAVRAVLELPAGALADRWSRRGCLIFAALAMSAGAALLVSLPSLLTAIAGESLFALGALHCLDWMPRRDPAKPCAAFGLGIDARCRGSYWHISWHEATDILLVRPVEGTTPELISPESLLEAELSAGPLDDCA